MRPFVSLHQSADESARRSPAALAVEDVQGRTVSYAELAALSDRLRDRLHRLGVRPGDRVGIDLRKSVDSVAAILGILKTGAAYVPVDPGAPVRRSAYVLHDCSVRVALVERDLEQDLRRELAELGEPPPLLLLEGTGGGVPLREALERAEAGDPAPPVPTAAPDPSDLAYILYTSGSTGRPKGVMLSHGHAAAYMDWCSDVFAPGPEDRFSSHAPFHFDLSILDVHLPLRHGARLVLFDEPTGKDPGRLAPLIAGKGISVWYSTPSILTLLLEYGRLEAHDWSALRIVLFAGEVFPVKHLRRLQSLWKGPAWYNLYGPTETNVCTFFRVPDRVPEDRKEPFPIGKPCAHVRARVTDEHGRDVAPGAVGELCIAGPAVMQGYWNLPEQTARAFWRDDAAERWYRTGDLVVQEPGGDYVYVGRRDRMVKRRGYRVELGEIEACLHRHPLVQEAAAVAVPDGEGGVRVRAFLALRPGAGKPPSLVALKRFCAENLPAYMIPDLFSLQDALPKTSTHKIDYQTLQGMS
jgi:amino acid adenylation domain-containing protein